MHNEKQSASREDFGIPAHNNIMKRIGIIGGGAAGMMAAATILEHNRNAHVFLFERNNRLGSKVLISGGGRCNVTTGIQELSTVLKKYPRGHRFLRTPIYAFPPEKVYNWFQSHGVPLKVEKDMRVFPKSNNGADVVGVFERIFEKHNAKVLLSQTINTIEKKGNNFHVETKKGDTYTLDTVIITTGGQAYRHTGSAGDGYTFAESLGHSITKLAPSLGSFITEEKWPATLAGVSFPYIQLKLNGVDDKYAAEGPFVFTHKGISGPCVFTLSSLAAFEKCSKEHPLRVTMDLVPHIPHVELEQKLLQAKNTTVSLFKAVHEYIPKSVADTILNLLEETGNKKAAETTDKSLRKIAQLLKALPISVIGKGVGDEFVTAGGIDLNEIDSKTMESKICPGLYFAGEVLNIDGFTGGFNLQASWATGRLAGASSSRSLLSLESRF